MMYIKQCLNIIYTHGVTQVENPVEKFVHLGKNITKFREEKNITINELSEKTGINLKYLKRIENGEALNISLSKHLFKIENALNINLSELFES